MKPTARWRFAGFLSTGKVDLICVSGTTGTPSVGAELIATPHAPKPWSSRICVITPPAEWPIRIGGWSSPPISASIFSTASGIESSTIGVGSALRASTSTSKPG